MPLSKQALRVLNNVNFPNNNAQYISPELLREFNSAMIDSVELTSSVAGYAQLNGDNTFVGNNTMIGDLTVTGTISASVIHTIYETASVIYSSGSNQLGDDLFDVQTLSGSVKVQGNLTINGIPVTAGQTTGSSLITASVNLNTITFTKGDGNQFNILVDTGSATNQDLGPLNAFTASQEITNTNVSASIARLNGQTGSYATTGSNTFYGNQTIDKASVLYTNGIYWNDSTVGYSNLEIINSATGNLDLAALNGRVRVVNSNLEIVSGTFTASLQEGYTYVGNGSGRTTIVATSSFGTSLDTGSFATTGSNTFTGLQTLDAPSRYGTSVLNIVSSSINFQGLGSRINFPNGGYFLGNPGDIMQFTTDGVGQQFQVGDSGVTPSARNLTFRNTSPNGNIQLTAEAGGGVSLSGSYTTIQGVNFIPFSQSLADNDASFAAKFATIGTQSGSWGGGGGSINTGSFLTTGSRSPESTQVGNGKYYFNVSTGGDATAIKLFNTGSDASGSMAFGVTDPGSPFIKLKERTWFQIQGGDDLNYINFTASFDNGASVGPQFGSRTMLLTTSGSLGLFNPTTQRAKVMTNFLANSTANNGVNIAFNTNTNTNNTIISGSNNIFVNPAAPSAGFTRFVGTTGNIELNASNVPQISSSMAFPVTMNNNIFTGNATTMFMRGPVSSSTWTIAANIIANANINIGSSAANNAEKIVAGLNFNGNYLTAPITLIANKTATTQTATVLSNINGGATTLNLNSSSMNYTANLTNGSFTINNNYYTTNATAIANGGNNISVSRNSLAGVNHIAIFSGSGVLATTGYCPLMVDNVIGGTSNQFFIGADATNNKSALNGTAIIGLSLIVTGSSDGTIQSDYGSAFFGRFNASDGIRNKSSDIILAVGTGVSGSFRKTGFLIDSGSNTYVEGTLNVSGSTSMTGSLTIQSGSGDLYMYGHKMFNNGEFWSTTTQSGSAGVSGSITFNSSGSLYGVSLANNSQLTVANAGTYNIQFSAQIETSAGADSLYIWYKKNGNNIAASATKLVLANNTAQVMTVNILDDAAANDYYEIAYQTLNGNALILAEVASGNIPAIPSVIATVTQVK